MNNTAKFFAIVFAAGSISTGLVGMQGQRPNLQINIPANNAQVRQIQMPAPYPGYVNWTQLNGEWVAGSTTQDGMIARIPLQGGLVREEYNPNAWIDVMLLNNGIENDEDDNIDIDSDEGESSDMEYGYDPFDPEFEL